ILQFTQLRAGLIEASTRSLLVQGEMIAGAIAGAATVEGDSSMTVDPNRMLDLQTGESYGPPDDFLYAFEFSINPERVAPLLRRLGLPTNTRARIYGSDGSLILDSRNLSGRGDVQRLELPPPPAPPPSSEKPRWYQRVANAVRSWFTRGGLPRYEELGGNGRGYPGGGHAPAGPKGSNVRVDQRGRPVRP